MNTHEIKALCVISLWGMGGGVWVCASGILTHAMKHSAGAIFCEDVAKLMDLGNNVFNFP